MSSLLHRSGSEGALAGNRQGHPARGALRQSEGNRLSSAARLSSRAKISARHAGAVGRSCT
jgi:hypothetical protein